jgi:predicted transcriptional regulator
LFYNPLLLFIAFFVWIGAAQEASLSQMQTAIGGIPVRQAMLTDFRTLRPDDSLERAIELTLAGSQKDFPVVDNGRIEGILTQTDLLKALSAPNRGSSVRSAMQENFVTVNSLDMLESAFARLKDCNCHTLPVTLDGQLLGLMTMDNLGEYMRIQAALKG